MAVRPMAVRPNPPAVQSNYRNEVITDGVYARRHFYLAGVISPSEFPEGTGPE